MTCDLILSFKFEWHDLFVFMTHFDSLLNGGGLLCWNYYALINFYITSQVKGFKGYHAPVSIVQVAK